jgi:plasmid stabilization system protein ParE
MAYRVRHLHETCGMPARNPNMSHRRDDLTSREDILFWPAYSYLIVYRPASKPLDIPGILRGARDRNPLLR